MIASIRARLLALAFCAVCAPVFAKVPIPARAEPGFSRVGRSITSLDAGWRFLRADAPGADAATFDDSAWSNVTLPHTFNGADGDDGGTYYRGVSWYRRALSIGTIPAGRRAYLQFDGAALASDVFVNGVHVGRHEGGYARFRFDVTSALRAGTNIIAVKVDNSRLPQIAPLGGDFTVFGGLYRHVSLVETADTHFDLLDAGGPGGHVMTLALSERQASLQAVLRLRNDGRTVSRARLEVAITDADGTTVATAGHAVKLAPGVTATQTVPLVLVSPHLWQGRADPHLYRVTATLSAPGGGDQIQLPLGLRTAVFDPAKGFLLNGKPYPLRGVNLFHSGRPGRGLAVTDEEIDEDIAQIDELGATAIRFVHFQHPQEAYDEADRRGLIVLTEIGLNGVIDPGEPFRHNIEQQMRELIRQNRNHPSIVLWGLGNEVYATTPDVTRVIEAAQAVAHDEDPSRPTIYAHCCQSDDNEKAQISDVIGFNRYFGWYPGQSGSIGQWADDFHAHYPGRPFAVSEYGAGASIRHQQVPPPQTNVPESGWHPEQAQTAYHMENWPQLAARPYLFGAFIWVAFDLASDGRHEGERPGINDKGLISYDRAVRKDAYFYYQANWSDRPMVHVADRRLRLRTEAMVPVLAFTNAPRASLTVNGQSMGEAVAENHVLRWPAVPLAIGENVVTVVASSNGQTLRDTVRWTRVPPSDFGAKAVPLIPPARPPAESAAPPGQEK